MSAKGQMTVITAIIKLFTVCPFYVFVMIPPNLNLIEKC